MGVEEYIARTSMPSWMHIINKRREASRIYTQHMQSVTPAEVFWTLAELRHGTVLGDLQPPHPHLHHSFTTPKPTPICTTFSTTTRHFYDIPQPRTSSLLIALLRLVDLVTCSGGPEALSLVSSLISMGGLLPNYPEFPRIEA